MEGGGGLQERLNDYYLFLYFTNKNSRAKKYCGTTRSTSAGTTALFIVVMALSFYYYFFGFPFPSP